MIGVNRRDNEVFIQNIQKMRFKILVILFVASSFFLTRHNLYAQQTVPNEYLPGTPINYVRTWDVVKPETNPNNLTTSTTLRQSRMATNYFDGLGRPLQIVSKQGSMATGDDAVDLVSPIVYDEFGREQFKYQSFAANNTGSNTSIADGMFKSNPFQQQATFMNSQYGAQGETYFYSQTVFEASPLNRATKTMAHGNSWVGSSRGVEIKYWSNASTDDVKIWNVTDVANGFGAYALASPISVYPTGALYKTVSVDEQGKQVIEFKDKNGKIILKKVQLTAIADDGNGKNYTGWLCTYYIYDDLNNLRCVIQPEGVKTLSTSSWSLTTTLLDEQCFRYEYDERNRMIKKKVPGAGEVWMVYDKRDRLVLTQDANLRTDNKWLFTKYDQLNRPIMTGFYVNGSFPSQSSMQGYLNSQNMSLYENYQSSTFPLYSVNQSFPIVNFNDVLTIKYYDDYSWSGWYGFGAGKDNGYDSYFLTPSNSSYPYPQSLVQSNQTKGMVTGSWEKNGTVYIAYYDDKARVIQTRTNNISGGIDITTTQYSFSGQILQSVLRHEKAGINAQTHTVITKYEYDDLSRLLSIKKTVNSIVNGVSVSKPEVEIVKNEYDKLGQLKTKKVGRQKDANGNYTVNPIETLAYDYNIRSWLLGVNRNYLRDKGSPSYSGNYFGFELGYDKAATTPGSTTFGYLQYNGNIAGTIWKSAGDEIRRYYDYLYDNANRLGRANYYQYANPSSGDTWTPFGPSFSVHGSDPGSGNNVTGNDNFIKYDDNGNILSMVQHGFTLTNPNTIIDVLSYNYYNNSNKLKGVTDGYNDNNSKMGDFKYDPLTKTSIDYEYDANGNLILDNNKKISSINYNFLNLPSVITVTGKGTITYTYDAAGNKLKKEVNETGQPLNTTLYMAGAVYENDELQFLFQEEGRIRFKPVNGAIPASFQYDYFIKDHLGNVRTVLTEEQKTDAYPVASLETASISNESTFYGALNDGRVNKNTVAGYPNDPYTNPNDFIQKLRGDGVKMGANMVLKVMAGDKFTFRVNSWYKLNSSSPNAPNPISDLAIALASGVAGVSGGKATATGLTSSGISNTAATSFLSNQAYPDGSKPKAYLNWIFLDEQFNYYAGGSDPVGGNEELKPHLLSDVSVNKNGYLYIYVSNETPNVNVFFDNLQVSHTRGPIIEETHYYPFGLTMSGISSKALAFGNPKNKYKFNDGTELANGEFADGTGLELYETPFRSYDPQIGRFHQTDAMSDDYEDWSPYTFALDNPINFNDPTGLEADPPKETSTEEKPKELSEVVVKSSKKSKWNYNTWAYFANKNQNHDYFDLFQYLKNEGVNDRGLELFKDAWNSIEYEERLHQLRVAQFELEGRIAQEVAMWMTGEGLFYYGGKLVSWGYRGYKAWRKVKGVEKGFEKSKVLLNSARQLQAKFKHAENFGVLGNYSKTNAGKFSAALNQHINSSGVQAINGTYRGQSVVHYLNPNTGLNVISKPSGEFISGWKLNPAQLQNVLSHGGL